MDAWRIMMSLKSGLLAESTWALDTLNVLLFDDSTVAYFGLTHLPGLIEVLLDHFRRCLIEMFDLFDETEIGCGHDDFKQNLIRMAILESAKENKDNVSDEEKEIKRVNKTIGKLEEQNKEESIEDSNSGTLDKSEPTDNVEDNPEVEDENCNKDTGTGEDVRQKTNYTYVTRQGKEVKVEEGSDPNGLLDDKYWDVYCEFGDQSELWEYGKGDVTEHVKTHFESGNETERCSKRFFRKAMKLKSPTESIKSENSVGSNSKDSISQKCESTESNINCSKVEGSIQSSTKNLESCEENEKRDSTEECTDSNSRKDSDDKKHMCNKFINGVTKSEPRDIELEKMESSESDVSEDRFNIAEKYFRDEPRMKLAVQYEQLDDDELVQRCKNSFGINTEGERMCVEDESYQRNEPPLCLISEARNEIGRRCVCISNIFRSLSCIPGNDYEMSRHAGLVYILGKLLLLHHKHLPRSRVRRKFDRDDVDETMVDTSQGMAEWWWDYLNMLRENTLVIFANVCAQLKLDKFPDEISLPVLEGLVHWVVCPSSCASDPLPTVSPISVLSPLRLVLEAMCKLCIHDKNVDMLLATPPYERIVQLFNVLTKLLANKSEQVTVEFSIVLLSELVKGGSSAARGVALQHPSISLLIDFLETAEQKASQVANMRSIQLLRENPDMMGTSLDMIRRAATVLLHLAKVPENRKLFVHQQSRLLSLVMSQILDQTVATILSDVLFQCSHHEL